LSGPPERLRGGAGGRGGAGLAETLVEPGAGVTCGWSDARPMAEIDEELMTVVFPLGFKDAPCAPERTARTTGHARRAPAAEI
jgi:hypothetical protein